MKAITACLPHGGGNGRKSGRRVGLARLTSRVERGQGQPERLDRRRTPAGVPERDWIPFSDKMGFVDTSPHPFPPADAMLAPPTEGYFMIRNRNGWHRIIIENPIKGPGTSG
jgi:hypothetical protein